MSLSPRQTQVLDVLRRIQPQAGIDPAQVRLFSDFVRAEPACCERTLTIGHLTGSAWLVDRSGGRVLLTHHRKLGRWLQLGGHADGDPDLAAVALREAEEESGLSGLIVEPAIFDLDRHRIPARGAEPEHWHYDVRFVVRTSVDEDFTASAESLALAWVDIAWLLADPSCEASIARMARRWLARGA